MPTPSAPLHSRLWLRTRAALVTAFSASLAALCSLLPAHAALPIGAVAPDFEATSALAGELQPFHLKAALARGPVVLYFYPKAFTPGCTVEAHQFAEASSQFEALGVTVLGLSNDDLPTLKRFSIEACRKRFAVAADPGARIIKLYDAKLLLVPGMADRISYFITPPGHIAAVHAKMSPEGHISAMLQAAQAWRAAQP